MQDFNQLYIPSSDVYPKESVENPCEFAFLKLPGKKPCEKPCLEGHPR